MYRGNVNHLSSTEEATADATAVANSHGAEAAATAVASAALIDDEPNVGMFRGNVNSQQGVYRGNVNRLRSHINIICAGTTFFICYDLYQLCSEVHTMIVQAAATLLRMGTLLKDQAGIQLDQYPSDRGPTKYMLGSTSLQTECHPQHRLPPYNEEFEAMQGPSLWPHHQQLLPWERVLME